MLLLTQAEAVTAQQSTQQQQHKAEGHTVMGEESRTRSPELPSNPCAAVNVKSHECKLLLPSEAQGDPRPCARPKLPQEHQNQCEKQH